MGKEKSKLWIPDILCFDCKFNKDCDIRRSLKSFDVRNNTLSLIWDCEKFEEEEYEEKKQ